MVLGRGPGVARRASNFLLLRQKKVTKEKATPSLRPLRGAKGRPAPGRLRGAPWNSLCAGARRSDNHGESVNEAWALRRPCSPRNRPVAGASSRGVDSRTSTRAIASLGPISRAQAPRAAQTGPSNAMARMDVRWVPFCACREAQGRGCVRVPKDTRTSCTDSPQLFERSAAGAQRVLRWHPLTEHRRLPAAQRRDAHSRVAFSLVTFSWRDKRKLLRRRAHTPAPALSAGA